MKKVKITAYEPDIDFKKQVVLAIAFMIAWLVDMLNNFTIPIFTLSIGVFIGYYNLTASYIIIEKNTLSFWRKNHLKWEYENQWTIDLSTVIQCHKKRPVSFNSFLPKDYHRQHTFITNDSVEKTIFINDIDLPLFYRKIIDIIGKDVFGV